MSSSSLSSSSASSTLGDATVADSSTSGERGNDLPPSKKRRADDSSSSSSTGHPSGSESASDALKDARTQRDKWEGEWKNANNENDKEFARGQIKHYQNKIGELNKQMFAPRSAPAVVAMREEGATAWINALFRAELECINEETNLSVLRLRDAFGNVLPSLNSKEQSSTVFVRQDDIDTWTMVVQRYCSSPGRATVMTGNPGIGKSRSAEYAVYELLRRTRTRLSLCRSMRRRASWRRRGSKRTW